MSARDRRAELLAAWQDGELRGFASRRAGRLVERSAEARREVELLGAVGGWVREAEQARPFVEPDEFEVWSALPSRLAALDAEGAEVSGRGWLQHPLVAGAALAAAAVALVVGVLIRPISPAADVVQWLDSQGAPVMVLDGLDDTIIWVLKPGNEEISGRGSRFAA